MSLKELTYEHHRNAERQQFVKVLMSGHIDPKLYATFMYNQHQQYNILEVCSMSHGLMNGLMDIRRAPNIWADYEELWEDKDNPPELLSVTKEYADHIMSIKDDEKKLFAHIYTRHMGDLSGGQMIRKKIPGSGTLYNFENGTALKELIRERLDDSMADEAKICFDFATKTFQELMDVKLTS
jgi:heme oxygenase